ncbi:MAG: hypothetical protein L0271_08910 [Gemmatimonadetes bacterium]|nr:hypothetical protein [Gemmatimonadota bacterium]
MIVVLLLLIPRPLTGQRADLAAHRDSLGRVDDVEWLRAEVERIPDSADARGTIARGLAALRLYELTGDARDAKRARAAFESARDRSPHDAWAEWAVGVSWADGPEIRSNPTIVTGRAFARVLGLDPRSRAIDAFRQALRLDPAHLAAAEALVPLAAEARNREALHEAHRSLDHAAGTGVATARSYLALAAASRALGDFGAAADAARLADAVRTAQPTDAATVARAETSLAIARSLFGVPGQETAAARAWFDGVDALTPAIADAYFEDVRILADEFDRERWAHADLAGRRAWLRELWALRAALAGVPPADRIAEHYRRLDYAREWYPRRRVWGAPPGNALLLERPDAPFDDRGIIYVRHGEPIEIIRTLDARLPNESWVYRLPDGGFRMLHFANYGSAVRSSTAAGDPEFAGFAGGVGDAYNEFVLVYNLPCGGSWVSDRAARDPSLGRMRSCGGFDVRSVSAEVRRDAREALRTDTDAPDFARPLPFFYDLHTFRGASGHTDLVAALIVAGDQLAAAGGAIEPGAVQYGIDVSFIVIDTMFARIARVDTMLWIETDHRLGQGEWLRAHVTLPVLPGPAAVQRVIVRDAADPSHGQLYGSPFELPDYRRSSLTLSDIVLAEPDEAGTFRRGDVALSFVPTRVFAGGTFNAFYEIYHLAENAPFATEILVEHAGGGIGRAISRLFGGGPIVRLRFDGVAEPDPDGMVRELRRVETALEPGSYRIRVIVTDRTSGQKAERQREFVVREKDETG